MAAVINTYTVPQRGIGRPDYASDVPEIRRIDLSTANVDEEITYSPADYIRVYCDGILDGISVKLHDQNSQVINLSEFDFVPLKSNKLYLTSDVRAGRSYLKLLLGRGQNVPFGRNYGGGGGGGITLAEMAARLGSANIFDRRGEVVWMDDFESNIEKWRKGGQGAGNAVALSTVVARNGAKSAELKTGSDGLRTSWIQRYFPYPKEGRIGIEVSFALEDALEDIRFSSNYYSGSWYHFAGLKYVRADETLYYRQSGATDSVIATGIDLHGYTDLFHTWKLVIDLITHKYVRAILNNQEYDLSDKPCYNVAQTITARGEVEILTTGPAGSNIKTYIDDLIITQNEP